MNNYLTVAEAAKKTRASERTIRELCNAGRFPGAQKVGSRKRGTWLIPAADLAGFKRRKSGRPKPVSQPV